MKASFCIVLLLCFYHSGSAQLCSGSLGDPVVNITFGSGSGFGNPLNAATTSYNYVANSCPSDGNYTIYNSGPGCFNGNWHVLSEDHTPGDVNGYMMVVNASYTPGDFYVDTVKGLCAGTTYEFAAWILNVEKLYACSGNPIKPNVTFQIETATGTVLLTNTTGDIPSTDFSPEWKQYGAFFTTPSGVSSVVIRMTNNAPGGCGNDLLLDDITFRPCGALAKASVIAGGTQKNICVGDRQNVPLSATVTPSDNNTRYQWQVSTNNGTSWNDVNGANTTSYTAVENATVARTSLYRLTVAEVSNIGLSNCRVASNPVAVVVNGLPVPNAQNNGPKCEGDSLTLSAEGGQNYTWTGPNNFTSTVPSPIIKPLTTNKAGKYRVVVTTAAGCTNIDSTVVVVNTKVTANAGADVKICKGSSTTLNGGTGVSYTWAPSKGLSNNNTASPVATPDTTTTYVLTVSNGQCKALDSVTITVLLPPIANAGPDKKIFQGQSTVLNGSISGGAATFSWTPAAFISNTRALQPTVTPKSDTTYTLRAVSTIGCGSSSDNVFVRVFKALKIPNAFSPNGDGINDEWRIEAIETYPEAAISIFNRYGQLMYSGSGAGQPWNGTYNGKVLPVGTYYYVIDLKNDLAKLSGSVTLFK